MLLISLTIRISSASFEFLLSTDLGFIGYARFIFRCFGTGAAAAWRGQLNLTICDQSRILTVTDQKVCYVFCR